MHKCRWELYRLMVCNENESACQMKIVFIGKWQKRIASTNGTIRIETIKWAPDHIGCYLNYMFVTHAHIINNNECIISLLKRNIHLYIIHRLLPMISCSLHVTNYKCKNVAVYYCMKITVQNQFSWIIIIIIRICRRKNYFQSK